MRCRKPASPSRVHSASVGKVTWSDETLWRRASSIMRGDERVGGGRPGVGPAAAGAGPVTGVNGTAHCSFG